MEFRVFQAASVGPRPWDELEPRRFREVAYAGEHVLPQFRKGGGPRA